MSEVRRCKEMNFLCRPKSIDKDSGLVEDFICAVKTNNIEERCYAFAKNKVCPAHVKSFPAVRFSKKINGGKCGICLGSFKTNEKLLKMKCSNYLHCKCVSEWLARSVYCPLCKEILS